MTGHSLENQTTPLCSTEHFFYTSQTCYLNWHSSESMFLVLVFVLSTTLMCIAHHHLTLRCVQAQSVDKIKLNDYCVYVPTDEGSGLVLETRLGGGNKRWHLNKPSIGSTENLNFFTC